MADYIGPVLKSASPSRLAIIRVSPWSEVNHFLADFKRLKRHGPGDLFIYHPLVSVRDNMQQGPLGRT